MYFNLLKVLNFNLVVNAPYKCNEMCLKLLPSNLLKKSIVKKILVLLD